MKRRIKEASITFVSLCPKGKNKLPTIFKEDGSVEFDTIIKDDVFEAEGELTAVVYAPEIRDTDGDIASAEVVKQMAYDYMRRGGALDVRHDGKPLTIEQAFIAETFLIQKDDPRFTDMKTSDGVKVDVTGGWAMVVKVDDPELRKAYGEDGWGGVSIFGQAKMEVEDDDKVTKAIEALGKMLSGNSSEEEIDMKQEELLAALEKNNEGLVKSLAEILKPKPEEKPEVKKGEGEDDKIKFEGDPTNKTDIEKHLAKVRKAQLLKTVDFDDPEALAKHAESLEKSDGDDEGDGDSDEVKRLKAELAKAQGKSGQPAKKGKKVETDEIPAGLSKEEAEGFAVGHKMGKHSNETRGFGTK